MRLTLEEKPLVWVPTTDVKVGDRIACLLADAHAYPIVASWYDWEIDLTRYDLDVHHYRTFVADFAPWWVSNRRDADGRADKENMMTFLINGEALIVERSQP